MLGWIILIIILVVIGGWFVITYNSFITMRHRVKNGWAQIDVQLKRRYDLIPNLVETVKGYAKYEREVFEKITELRTRAMGASSVKEIGDANNQLVCSCRKLPRTQSKRKLPEASGGAYKYGE